MDNGDRSRLSLAYKRLEEPPMQQLLHYKNTLLELDLSNNKIIDLRFLSELPYIQTLVLDNNQISSHVKMPLCRNLHTLWVNHNKIDNLGLFITTIAKSCPNLKILSMMNNVAAPSYFNGGSYPQYVDYRYFVISSLPKLEILDYSPITPEEKSEAKRIYPMPIVQEKSNRPKRKKQSTE